jgi:hypothetical protein
MLNSIEECRSVGVHVLICDDENTRKQFCFSGIRNLYANVLEGVNLIEYNIMVLLHHNPA